MREVVTRKRVVDFTTVVRTFYTAKKLFLERRENDNNLFYDIDLFMHNEIACEFTNPIMMFVMKHR